MSVHTRDMMAAFALLLACAAPAAATTAGARLESGRVLASKLAATGRATATIERRSTDPLTGQRVVQQASLALEPPDRTRLDFGGGESLALRGDGGEWLQPALGQMLRLGAEASEAARRWWDLLLPAPGTRYSETRLAARQYRVIARDGADADTARVTLDAAGLPASLRFAGPDGEPIEVTFRAWRFAKARGPSAFTLQAPHGVSVIDLR